MIAPFKLERYFAQYEFNVKYLLSASDCESLGMDELLRLASPESRALWENLRLGYTNGLGIRGCGHRLRGCTKAFRRKAW